MPRDENGDPYVECDGEDCEQRIYTTVKGLDEYNQIPYSKRRCRDCADSGDA